VYMMFEQTPSGPKELKLKVLDMGMGHERNAWFVGGTETSYETTFPTVVKRLYKVTGINPEKDLMKKFLPYAAYLNADETEDIEKAWQTVAKKLKMTAKALKEKILPLAALYSVGEHSRSLLFAIADGGLPSNAGGGYNLRVILRRALGFIDKYGWKIDIADLCEEHAKYLKPIFPELIENIDEVKKILEVEKNKFIATKQKSRQIVSQIIKEEINTKKLIELYDSQGISPDIIAEELAKQGKKIAVPENFYSKVSEMHEKKKQETATKREEKLELGGIPETEVLYYEDFSRTSFEGKVLKIIDKNVVLDRTVFYPTSGGQLHDIGTLNGERVVNVFKQGSAIVHIMADKPKFKQGSAVKGEIDYERRLQLAQHHTATHIVNAAARRVLGKHINQAGAKKALDKAHLDITHYESISEEEMEKISKEANKIVKEGIPVKSTFLPRNEAEKRYGMAIYQGGAVPGKKIRIIEIPEVDVEACAGTHLKNTADVGKIVFIKTTKISDGIVRIVFTAGMAAEQVEKAETNIVDETAKILGCKPEQVPGRSAELFDKWKKARSASKKGKRLEEKNAYELVSTEEYKGDALAKTAEVFKTQPEHIAKTAKRFLSELKEWKRK
jgi:alanyl-tRNA synthetase